ncbi:arylesterase [Altererythrobacter aestiaquae]|uniref:Arylesterase n=2 Tax=Pontixanthobacter aestiaquae TaxID=1509367 RepID=A0A844ZA03_9SPHN|nr:arylesterase [Pontixanthobacter aestiaquae]
MGPERRILAFGNSLFAGYNVASEDSYPAKLEASLRAKGINARVTNAGVSGDTTAAGLQRLTFTLDGQQDKPDLFILELGGNDLLRGLPVTETRKNIEAMLQELQKREIPVLLMGMRAPPNFAEFQNEFDSIYPQLAQQYGAELVPFFLESIYQKPEMIQSDRVHPTEEGIETLVGATVEAVVRALPEE